MSHHELLDAAANNVHVIMLNHSNSERGFLPVFANILRAITSDSIEILISKTDEDPLNTY